MSEAEHKSVITVLRSLANSRQNCTLADLGNDFAQTEGITIPFRKFGFASLPLFLTASGQFMITPYNTIITKCTAESAHINKLVAEQNPGKKKKSKQPMLRPQPQRHLHPTTFRYPQQPAAPPALPFVKKPGWGYKVGYNFLNYNSIHHKASVPRDYSVPQNGTPIAMPPRRSNLPSVTFTFDQAAATASTVAQPDVKPKVEPVTVVVNPVRPSVESKVQPIQATTNLKPSQQPTTKPINYPSDPVPSAVFSNIESRLNVQSNHQPPCKPPAFVNQPPNAVRPNIHSRLQAPVIIPKQEQVDPSDACLKPHHVQQTAPVIPIKVSNQKDAAPIARTTSSVQDRLRIRSDLLRTTPTLIQIKYEPNFRGPQNLDDAAALLERYAERKGWSPPPKYEFVPVPMSCRIECRITLNNNVYTSSPRDFDTAFEAKRVLARDLLTTLLHWEANTLRPVVSTTGNFVETLHAWLKKAPNGIFIDQIPDLIRQELNVTVPADWMSMVKQSPGKFSVSNSCGVNDILYAENVNTFRSDGLCSALSAMSIKVKPVEDKMQATIGKNIIDLCSPVPKSKDVTNSVVMDNLVLPWADRSWNVNVTNAVSTVEVWARMIGPEYSNKLDDLMVDIEMDLMHEKNRPTTLEVGHFYLAATVYTHRVRLVREDAANAQCLCFCIDSGFEEWFPTDQILVCRPEFIKFPAQAICLSLFGLNDCAGHPNAAACLKQTLADKSLIADVLSFQIDYEDQLGDANQTACIKVILYDTSSTIDVQLNDVLLNEIRDYTLAPTLASTHLNDVTIAHISDSGDILCNLRSHTDCMQFVQSCIARLVATNRAPQRFGNTVEAVNPQALYLVRDPVDGQFYRAKIVQHTNKQYQMLCVDVGKLMTVAKENIHCLDSIVLGQFPFQAIVCRLADVGVLNAQMVDQLRAYLKCGTEAMVKVIAPLELVPKVKIFMRIENGPLICVNNSLQLEMEIKMLSAPIVDQKPDVTKLQAAANACVSRQLSLHTTANNPLRKCENPKVGELCKVQVTDVCSPHNFKIRAHRQRRPFEQMMESLQKYAEATADVLDAKDVRAGQPYACKRDNLQWCRAVVQKPFNESTFVIKYCDFGDVDVVKGNALKPLPEQFRALPELAINARLTGVAPLQADWRAEDCVQFRRLLEHRNFVSYVERITTVGALGEDLQVELRLIDVSSGEDIDISKVLVQTNIAIKSK